MKNVQKEEFKDVEGYDGLYQVSNLGNVKSLKYGKERILKSTNNGHGYLLVALCKDTKRRFYQVHRLVAEAFMPNSDNKPQVNHKDEDKTNNNVENLEWVTAKENTNYGTRNIRISETHKGVFINRADLSISVDMLTKQGEFIRQFPSTCEAERWLQSNGFPKASNANINRCCQGKRGTHCGFRWRYSQTN